MNLTVFFPDALARSAPYLDPICPFAPRSALLVLLTPRISLIDVSVNNRETLIKVSLLLDGWQDGNDKVTPVKHMTLMSFRSVSLCFFRF